MRIGKIHHVAVICTDYKKSKAFYTEILGLKPVNEVYREERNSHKLDLQVGNHAMIELFSFPNPPARPSYPEAAGLRHLAFETADLDKMIEYLAENGVECEPIRIDNVTNKRFTFFKDPDELPIELYEN
ncbi:SMU1112c/YaeR family gloxylase I-like metalloprotein [Bacillus marinisedimentorum]|uniref:SMU1112c/YaeR family gloxylase I-like metalloprotein n=1 Tax=Bacillus marinisedimentorum TaxID=1821260 RepID=UPI0007E033BB|nr:VOC family protein [Bacillus marinisedimentorum]